MHFDCARMKKEGLSQVIYFIFSIIFYLLFSTITYAGLIERVVAIVNEDVILLSEFKGAFEKAVKEVPERTDIDVLNEIINKRLLLEEAKRFIPVERRGDLQDDNALIMEYINIKIRPFVHVPVTEIELYYMENRGLFKGKNFYEVKDEIEAMLMEDVIKQRLNEHIRELRDKAYIRIQLFEHNPSDFLE